MDTSSYESVIDLPRVAPVTNTLTRVIKLLNDVYRGACISGKGDNYKYLVARILGIYEDHTDYTSYIQDKLDKVIKTLSDISPGIILKHAIEKKLHIWNEYMRHAYYFAYLEFLFSASDADMKALIASCHDALGWSWVSDDQITHVRRVEIARTYVWLLALRIVDTTLEHSSTLVVLKNPNADTPYSFPLSTIRARLPSLIGSVDDREAIAISSDLYSQLHGLGLSTVQLLLWATKLISEMPTSLWNNTYA
jgi:hypothetical protein